MPRKRTRRSPPASTCMHRLHRALFALLIMFSGNGYELIYSPSSFSCTPLTAPLRDGEALHGCGPVRGFTDWVRLEVRHFFPHSRTLPVPKRSSNSRGGN
ncbi:hypothetical protein BDV96DRAFT_147251 [Lophiotrema nucula]|uniref:Secreted protein n=1 Tax=Lophiotrema nucula TaxID=690887 RepID=A0A6A5Z3Q5_9PLEO|nr:hypothetical protein BDV96DRAFT_147251 [Lophiotrema nucula]